MLKIYHNPRCRKSRETLAILKSKGKNPEIVEYLQNPPDEQELSAILGRLGIKAEDLIRKNEQVFKDHFRGQNHSDQEWVRILTENPKLIERPIVVTEKGARIGRPPEKILEIL